MLGLPNPILDEIDRKHAELSPPAQQAIALSGASQSLPPGPAGLDMALGSSPAPAAAPPAPFASPVIQAKPLGGSAAPLIRGGQMSSDYPAQQSELQRLTQPPLPTSIPRYNSDGAFQRMQGNPLAHTKADTGQTGIGQIHNPAARGALHVLDAIGTGLFPGIMMGIPGTQLHHQLLVGNQEGLLNEDAKRSLEGAQADEAEGVAYKDSLPPRDAAEGKTVETDQGVMQYNPRTGKYDIKAGGVPTKEAGKTIETADGIMQFNPQSGKYDIPVGDAPGKYSTQHAMTPDGSVVAITTDAKTGQPKAEVVYHGDPKIETDLTEVQINGKDHKVLINKRDGTVVKDLGIAGQKPSSNDHGVTVITGDGKVERLTPGQSAPTDFRTPNQQGSMNTPTTATRGAGEQGEIIVRAGDELIHDIQANRNALGNLGSYWNQLVNQSPIADKTASSLMSKIASFAALQPRLHGFRSHDAMREFAGMIGGIPKDPDALIAAIKGIQQTAGIVSEVGKGKGDQGSSIPTVNTQAEYDRLPSGAVYMEDGKQFKKP